MAILPGDDEARHRAERRGARARPRQRLRSRAPQAARRRRAAPRRLRGARGVRRGRARADHRPRQPRRGVPLGRREGGPAGAARRDGARQATASAGGTRARCAFAADFAARIEFAPWFYYAGGVAYIEHGHQYDTLCSTEHVMAPLSPLDPRRIARSFSDVLLRWVVRPTSGVPGVRARPPGRPRLRHDGRAHMGFGGLVRLLGALHRGASWSSSACGARTSPRPRRRCARSTSGAWQALAQKTRIGIEKLRALAALQVPAGHAVDPEDPGERAARPHRARRSRLGIALTALAVFAPTPTVGWAAIGARGARRGVACTAQLTARREAWFGEKLDNDATLVERAGHLAHLFPAAFVVMGHTHSPAMVPVAAGRGDLRERRLVARGGGRGGPAEALPRGADAPRHPPREGRRGPGGGVPRVERRRARRGSSRLT